MESNEQLALCRGLHFQQTHHTVAREAPISTATLHGTGADVQLLLPEGRAPLPRRFHPAETATYQGVRFVDATPQAVYSTALLACPGPRATSAG